MPTIKSENWDGVTAPAIPSGWTVDTQLVTATTNSPTSAPNSLIDPAANGSSGGSFPIPHATWATLDTNSGNVQVSATVRHANSGAGASDQDVWVFARCPTVAAFASWGTLSYYWTSLNRNGTIPGLQLNKRVSGTTTQLGRVGATAFADATNYRIYLLCSGSTIVARCQRLSDGFWLNSSGIFVSDSTNQTVAISVTDTALGASAGYSGAAFYLDNTSGGAVGLDDWLLETPPASFSASPARLVAGSGAQTVTLAGTLTNFSTGSSSQFTLSGGTGASIVSQSASSGTAATLSINPGTTSGTLTITDTTDASITTTIAVSGTYYVSPSGSDSNTGLDTAHAWQTISHVNAQTLHPGDTVLFQGGQTFSGNLLIQNSGSAAYPITIGSYGTGAATISPGTGTGIKVQDAAYVRLSALSVSGPGVSVSGSTSSTTSTGAGVEVITTQTQASVASWQSGIYLNSLTVSGCYTGINVHSHGGAATTPFPVGFADLRITNCTVHDCLNVGIKVWSNNATTGDYLGIENGTGNVPYHKNVYIAGCAVSNIYGDSAHTTFWTGSGIVVGNTNVGTTERCLVTNCGQADGQIGGGGSGANWCYACTGYVIQFCESSHQHDGSGIDGIGFDLDGGCQTCIVQYCYSHDNDGTGYIYGTYSGSGATQNNTFRYNISQNDGRLINGAALREFGSPSGTLIYNNTFYCGSAGTHPQLIEASAASFYNNILWVGSGVALLSSVSGATFAGNLYWFGGASFSLVYGGTTYSSLAAWQLVQETLGGVAYGLYADPQLLAPGSGGAQLPAQPAGALSAYNLAPSSAAIDAALDLRAQVAIDPGLLDFHGLPNRVGVSYDIGACEYGASALVGSGSGLRRVNLAGGIGG